MARKRRKVGTGGKPPGKEPSHYDGWLKRGRAIVTECQLSECFDRGDVAAAVDAFDRAIALLPNHPAAWHLPSRGTGGPP